MQYQNDKNQQLVLSVAQTHQLFDDARICLPKLISNPSPSSRLVSVPVYMPGILSLCLSFSNLKIMRRKIQHVCSISIKIPALHYHPA